jgi:SAM-dependent methyltransferase
MLLRMATLDGAAPQVNASACFSLQEDPSTTVWGKCVYAQAMGAAATPTDHVCSSRGVSFFGRCFCAPHFDGDDCKMVRKAEQAGCTSLNTSHIDDGCLRHPTYGSAIIPAKRWRRAQAGEQRAFVVKHVPQHLARASSDSGVKKELPPHRLTQAIPAGSLGRLMELGAGPLSQTYDILERRPDLSVREVIFEDPGIRGYLRNNITRYTTGRLATIPVTLLPVGAEEVPPSYFGTVDTVVMINTIEHAFNAFALLHTAYQLLRHGGLFVFEERIIKRDARWTGMETHPIRLRPVVYEHFFLNASIFSGQRRFLLYADVGKRPRKAFMEETIAYLAYKR